MDLIKLPLMLDGRRREPKALDRFASDEEKELEIYDGKLAADNRDTTAKCDG